MLTHYCLLSFWFETCVEVLVVIVGIVECKRACVLILQNIEGILHLNPSKDQQEGEVVAEHSCSIMIVPASSYLKAYNESSPRLSKICRLRSEKAIRSASRRVYVLNSIVYQLARICLSKGYPLREKISL